MSAPEAVERGFAVTAPALVGDELWLVRYSVSDRAARGLGARSVEVGEIQVSLHGKAALLPSLPDNYLRPANDEPLTLYQGDGRIVRLRAGVSAEDYANVVLIAHWLAWPLVIVLASRRLVRRAQQQ